MVEQANPFLNHLTEILSLYELSPVPTSVPKYDGPHDSQTDAIERGIAELARRVLVAEAALANKPFPSHDPEAESTDQPPPVPPKQQQPTAGSPQIVTPGLPLDAASESGMSAVEELKLLKDQIQDVTRVCKAVATGDLTQKITIPVQSAFMIELKDEVNSMVDKLGHIAEEVTRAVQQLSTEGKLGGQAMVVDVEGSWRHLTNAVNKLLVNLTLQIRSISEVTKAVARGDLSRRIEVHAKGEILDLKNTVNGMVTQFGSFVDEVSSVAREVGTKGVLGGQARVAGARGEWLDLAASVNNLANNLTIQVRCTAAVTSAILRGDLSTYVEVDVQGEMHDLKLNINSMVKQLDQLASDVSRVSFEVGKEGKLGGQVKVEGAQGTWKVMADRVNSMAHNLTTHVRGVIIVMRAVADGNLAENFKKLPFDSQGEFLVLKETVNGMTDHLSLIADEVERVTKEVGTDGVVSAVANVPNAGGSWKSLVDNVNVLATNVSPGRS